MAFGFARRCDANANQAWGSVDWRIDESRNGTGWILNVRVVGKDGNYFDSEALGVGKQAVAQKSFDERS